MRLSATNRMRCNHLYKDNITIKDRPKTIIVTISLSVLCKAVFDRDTHIQTIRAVCLEFRLLLQSADSACYDERTVGGAYHDLVRRTQRNAAVNQLLITGGNERRLHAFSTVHAETLRS